MSKIRRIMKDLFTAICIVVIASMIISKLLTGWSSIFSYRVFYIMSESMEPQINTNQLILGKYVPEDEELEIGGIYAYRREGIWGEEIIIHRLIEITEDGKYRFKGDNNYLPDEELIERKNIGYHIKRY